MKQQSGRYRKAICQAAKSTHRVLMMVEQIPTHIEVRMHSLTGAKTSAVPSSGDCDLDLWTTFCKQLDGDGRNCRASTKTTERSTHVQKENIAKRMRE